MISNPPDHQGVAIGPRIRRLRKANGLALAQLANKTGVSEATMSRIETQKSEASAAHLHRLADVLCVDIGVFFAATTRPLHSGARAVTRAGCGAPFKSRRLDAQVLCAELSAKKMHPFINHIAATSPPQAGDLTGHTGEEFLYVLTGTLILQTEAYAPLHLGPGDSIYFDASQPHAYACADGAGCDVIVITTADLPAQEKDPANA